MLEVGSTYITDFAFSQDQVEEFARLSGDDNPLHLDADYASKTVFKKPIIHGVLGASIFSKVMGTIFPGEGTIYLKQTSEFLRPMYVGSEYEAHFKVKEIDHRKYTAVIQTEIYDKASKKIITRGDATVMNKEKFNGES